VSELKVGDRVRVTVDAVVKQGSGPLSPGFPSEVYELDFGGAAEETFSAENLTLVEPADDPSKDPVGTVRKAPNGLVVVRGHVFRPGNLYHPGWLAVTGSSKHTHEQVTGWEVIGAVPGTPAWEAQQPREPRTFTLLGPEPPAVVNVVTDGGEIVPFLVRYGDHWRWSDKVAGDEDFGYNGGPWGPDLKPFTPEKILTEVVP
jgi:hypothetical protein